MLSLLFLTKLSAVITVIYAGMNLHQLTSSHAYLVEKIEQFRFALAETEAVPRLLRLNLVFYVALPIAYLSLLRVSAVAGWVLAALALKFAVTATMDIRAERRIVAGEGYTPMQHTVSRIDNVLNILTATGVIFFLLWPGLSTR